MSKKVDKEELKDRALELLARYRNDMATLQEDRRKALAAYMCEPQGDEVDGRSQVVMSDVADTIEWIMPPLMKIFFGGREVVECLPRGKDDDTAAKLMTDKVNFDMQRNIDGFTMFHDWFKSALLERVGAVKYGWDRSTKKRRVEYSGLTEQEYFALVQSPDFEADSKTIEEYVISESQTEPDPMTGELVEIVPAIKEYALKGWKVTRQSKPTAEALPSEELIFDVTAKTLADSELVAHRKRVHKNYLKRYKVTDESYSDTIAMFDSLHHERFKELGGTAYIKDADDDFVYIYECYLNDYSDDGEPVSQKLLLFGDQVLEHEENSYGRAPICTLTPIRMAHRLVGRSFFDLIGDLQKLRTALVRYILDNIYYQNNGRTVVNPHRLDIDDLFDANMPGGVVRTLYDVDPSSCLYPMPVNPLPPQAYNMLENVEEWKENRTGVTKYNQGMDSKSLNKTATGISQVMSAAQQRVELIARLFAETGVKDFFEQLVQMNIDYLDMETNIKLDDEWTTIDPRAISGEFDVIIDVGIGAGTKEVQINQLINMINVSMPLAQMGVVGADNFYQITKNIWELMGYKNAQKFVTDPAIAQQQMMQQQQMAMMQGGGVPPEMMQGGMGGVPTQMA